tara:strand:+ start:185 stop:490 length:306 start_codon:yes stop_codon:yes gene_type:complete
MGRVVTSFSVEVGSEAHQILESMRRKGRKISKVIGELLVHQYQLYDMCEDLAQRNSELLTALKNLNRAIELEGLEKVTYRDDFGTGKPIGLRLLKKRSEEE